MGCLLSCSSFWRRILAWHRVPAYRVLVSCGPNHSSYWDIFPFLWPTVSWWSRSTHRAQALLTMSHRRFVQLRFLSFSSSVSPDLCYSLSPSFLLSRVLHPREREGHVAVLVWWFRRRFACLYSVRVSLWFSRSLKFDMRSKVAIFNVVAK